MSATLRSLCVAIAAIAFVNFTAPARAQQPSPNALALAKELVDVVGAAREFESIPTVVITQTAELFLQAKREVLPDLKIIVPALIEETFPRRNELPNEVIKLYATRFTEQELKDAITFYKSPLGKKLLVESSSIINEAAKRADAWAAKFREEMSTRMRAELKKKGHEF